MLSPEQWFKRPERIDWLRTVCSAFDLWAEKYMGLTGARANPGKKTTSAGTRLSVILPPPSGRLGDRIAEDPNLELWNGINGQSW